MSFYQMMQLDPASNRKLRADASPETIRKLRLAMVARSALIVLFAIVFIGVMSTWFGAENSSMAVSIFCILLASRFVGFGYRISDSLLCMGLSFFLLLTGPVLALLPHELFWALAIDFVSLLAIIVMTCENPGLGNGGLYTFAYIFLSGNPVRGDAFMQRAWLTVLGFALCGFVLWHNHRDQNRDRTFVSILRGFSLRSYKCQWQLRLAFGVSLLLALFSTLDMTRFMWAGFACGSLLADVEVESHIHEKLRDRLLGAVIGSVAFWLIWSVLPVNLEPLLGPVGGMCLGLCAEYRHKTMLNCFGALSLAAGMYGLQGAVLLRIIMTLLGILFAILFFYVYDHFVMTAFVPEKSRLAPYRDDPER
ncbi:FUSC family protein [Faecalibaculum rodentium]|uniref:FUSC family protein n=1 Tax=Faecalibaculum rodentium TaxID=1702221 RepID=UPI0023EFBC38|nr:FUSC family protein [Faecalibaculum rodentium]